MFGGVAAGSGPMLIAPRPLKGFAGGPMSPEELNAFIATLGGSQMAQAGSSGLSRGKAAARPRHNRYAEKVRPINPLYNQLLRLVSYYCAQ